MSYWRLVAYVSILFLVAINAALLLGHPILASRTFFFGVGLLLSILGVRIVYLATRLDQ